MIDYALQYLKIGASVMPVGQDKRPLVAWKEFQTRFPTEEEVRVWWATWPNANIGLITGKISNLIVIDVEEGGDITRFPETDTVRTGGGGWHLYYAYEPFENKTRIFPLTDIRGDGGYVVAPPSIHASGNKYEIIKIVGRKPFPAELFNIQKTNKWEDLMSGSPNGARNETMTKITGRFMHFIPPAEWDSTVWPFLQWQNSKNTPPLGESELRIIYNSISKRALSDDREELTEDVEVLPLVEVARLQQENKKPSVSTGYKEFDEVLLGGLGVGDLTTISGATGHGKTTFAQSLTYHLTKAQVPCLWFSYEVLISELWRKFKDMGVEDSMIAYAPIKMLTGNVEWIEEKILEAKEKYGVRAVFIDHLGFLAKKIKAVEMANNFSAYLGSICRELKTIAIKTEVSIVLLVHVRKTYSKEADTEDIGHSAGVAQESDTVFIITRKRDKTDSDYAYTNETIIKIDKNRKTGNTVRKKFELTNGLFVCKGPGKSDYRIDEKEYGF